MFSLVTALVSPHTIDVLRDRKESLVSTLTSNANVLCFQPSDNTCLLQGEWENVKKAYAVLEELYLRSQAEAMVREMLKVNDAGDAQGSSPSALMPGSISSSLFHSTAASSNNNVISMPPAESSADHIRHWKRSAVNMHSPCSAANWSSATGMSMNRGLTDFTAARKQHRAFTHISNDRGRHKSPAGVSGESKDDGASDFDDDNHNHRRWNSSHRQDDALDDDDGPPVLSRENLNGTMDAASFSSDTSDPDELDCEQLRNAYTASSVDKTLLSKTSTVTNNIGAIDVNAGLSSEFSAVGTVSSSDGKMYLPAMTSGSESIKHGDGSLLAAENQIAAMEKVLLGGSTSLSSFERVEGQWREKRSSGLEPITPPLPPVTSHSATIEGSGGGQSNNASMALTQHVANAFRKQQQFSESSAGKGRRLPQFSSLFLGGAGCRIPPGVSQHSSWPYANLYNMHLSALHSMQIKQELNPAVGATATSVGGGVSGGNEAHDLKDVDLGYRLDGEDSTSASGGVSSGGMGSLQEMRCTRCDKTYRSETRMKEHVRTHDRDYIPVLHSCPKCGKSFTYRHNMVVHLRRFHYGWQPAKRHACRVCGIKFQKPYLLRLHEQKTHLIQDVSDSFS